MTSIRDLQRLYRAGSPAERQPEPTGSGPATEISPEARRVGGTLVTNGFCRPSRPGCFRVALTVDCRPRLGVFRPSGAVLIQCFEDATGISRSLLIAATRRRDDPRQRLGRGTPPPVEKSERWASPSRLPAQTGHDGQNTPEATHGQSATRTAIRRPSLQSQLPGTSESASNR